MKFPGDRLSVTLPRGSNYFMQKSGSIIYVSSNIMQIATSCNSLHFDVTREQFTQDEQFITFKFLFRERPIWIE